MNLLICVLSLATMAQATSQPRPHHHPEDEIKCEKSTLLTAAGDGSTPFGIGGLDITYTRYSDELNCSWTIEPEGLPTTNPAITILFSMFHIEHNQDYVKIYKNDMSASNLVVSLTSELVVPHAVRVEGASRLIVVFESDEAFHLPGQHERWSSHTFQVGFNATYYDSSTGQCPGDCNGHGQCNAGVCTCDSETSVEWTGDDCSVRVPIITSSTQMVPIRNVGIGEWSYVKFVLPHRSFVLVEARDEGDADSDAFLVVSGPNKGLPTLTPGSFQYEDWLSWYYDCSDDHLIRTLMGTGTYYVGVTNHKWRAKARMDVDITVRYSNNGFDCVRDCAGHGTCNNMACQCDDGWRGKMSIGHSGLENCAFPVNDIASNYPFSSGVVDVRVGDWVYYKFTVTPEQAKGRLLISLSSFSPRAQPILLLKKGEVPYLNTQYLPTYDAFVMDYGDEAGFDLLSGQQQNILLEPNSTLVGDWYIGVFNIWGFTGIISASHDTASMAVYVNFFYSGKPCPRDGDDFCDGVPDACDYNTGVCNCPTTRLGTACGFPAETLSSTPGNVHSHTLPIGESMYYVFDVTEDMIENKLNLVLTMTKAPTEIDRAFPLLLARKGAVPYAQNFSDFDDHDIESHFYHDLEHQLLIDREELSVGAWYFAVINAQDSEEPLQYHLNLTLQTLIDCPPGADGKVCDGAGTCDRTLGRCTCDEGRTMDDCAADGVFFLPVNNSTKTVADIMPPITVDDWAYWAIGVGCDTLEVEVDFTQHNKAATAPLLTMMHNKLPLMTEDTADYYDYFRGIMEHEKTQGIRVLECPNEPCVVYPGSGGTVFATGLAKPGIYYIGVYNDFRKAQASITDYTLSYKVSTPCSGNCSLGFVGDQCDIVCPGMIPTGVYSNSPFSSGVPCHDHGVCGLENGVSKCTCDADHHGDSCEIECPGMNEGDGNDNNSQRSCSGRGVCLYHPTEETMTTCECENGYRGAHCELPCPAVENGNICSGVGECDLSYGRFGDSSEYSYTAMCICDEGFAGTACQLGCGQGCSGHGTCHSIHDSHGANTHTNESDYVLECSCDIGYHGDDCSLACPGVVEGSPIASLDSLCSGHGACGESLVEGVKSAKCACYHGWMGENCSEIVPPTPRNNRTDADDRAKKAGGGDGGDDNTTIIIIVVVLVLVVIALIVGFVKIYRISEARKEQLKKFQAPFIPSDSENFDEPPIGEDELTDVQLHGSSEKGKKRSGSYVGANSEDPNEMEMGSISVNVPDDVVDPEEVELR